MTHSDDDGLVLPPRIASSQAVILPVIHKEEARKEVLDYCYDLANEMKSIRYHGHLLDVVIDEREMRGGEKTWSWIKKGVPLRIEIGPRDIEKGQVCLSRRDQPHKEKKFIARGELLENVKGILDEMQETIYRRAVEFRDSHIVKIDEKEEFYTFFTPKNQEQPEIHGGFAFTHWCGEREVEERIQKDLGVTIRCIPLEMEKEEGICPFTGKKSPQRVLFAKAY
jgi:prolyl-tRNA synthetase